MVYFIVPGDLSAADGVATESGRHSGTLRAVSEEQFLRYCQLNLREDRDKRLYDALKDEAVEGVERLHARTFGAADQAEGRPPGIAWASEEHIREEIAHIAAHASDETRQVYMLFPSTNGDNWILRWLLFDAAKRLERAYEDGNIGGEI